MSFSYSNFQGVEEAETDAPFLTAVQMLLDEHEREKGVGVPLKILMSKLSPKLNRMGALQLINADEWEKMSDADQSRAMERALESLEEDKNFPTDANWCGRRLTLAAKVLLQTGIDVRRTDPTHAGWTLRRIAPEEFEEERLPFIKTAKIEKMMLNQILYGPPGTGKTYNSIRRAVEIIDGESGENPQARFEELRKNGQIEFVTFHQSFSYEEFIEGLRPVIGDESGQVSYEIRAGILKKIALRAISANAPVPTPVRVPKIADFDEIWAEMEKRINARQTAPIKGLSNGSRYELYFDPNNGDLRGKNLEGEKGIAYESSKEKQKKVWDKFKHQNTVNSPDVVLTFGYSASGGFIAAVFNYMKTLQTEVERNFGVQLEIDSPKFVLIIDEINRGNISKILGELITLLEDDKRIGAPNELRLTLPTSGETFALPPNLYILGTMNTSDKSLAQLDVALRRRFSFEEMAPRLELCDKFAAQIPVLQEFNNRLEWALDREHRLGHAYFMRVQNEDDFNEVFKSKVLPLLLEYFPHDFQTLGHVLGRNGNGFLVEMPRPEGFTSGKKFRWWFESDVVDFSAFEQLKSNYGL